MPIWFPILAGAAGVLVGLLIAYFLTDSAGKERSREYKTKVLRIIKALQELLDELGRRYKQATKERDEARARAEQAERDAKEARAGAQSAREDVERAEQMLRQERARAARAEQQMADIERLRAKAEAELKKWRGEEEVATQLEGLVNAGNTLSAAPAMLSIHRASIVFGITSTPEGAINNMDNTLREIEEETASIMRELDKNK
jgi:multidrug efflux pump subunit AcrA (membrane-fusion protein)